MAIDVYSLCPCQSGKKIKFCCGKDIVSEIDQVYQRIQSNQLESAIKLIERTEEAKGCRDCLSILKSSILISGNDLAAANETVEDFLARNPKHPVGMQHAVQIAIRSGNDAVGCELFQDAMEAVEEVLPATTAATARDVAIGYVRTGRIPAALAHLRFAESVSSQDDKRLAQILTNLLADGSIHRLLKHDFMVDPPASIPDFESQPWAKSYANVQRLVERGQFRRALKLIRRIDEKFLTCRLSNVLSRV